MMVKAINLEFDLKGGLIIFLSEINTTEYHPVWQFSYMPRNQFITRSPVYSYELISRYRDSDVQGFLILNWVKSSRDLLERFYYQQLGVPVDALDVMSL